MPLTVETELEDSEIPTVLTNEKSASIFAKPLC